MKRIGKKIKTLVALGAGAVMLGSTIFGAMAYNLGDFPQPFVQNGQFNGYIVVGAAGQASDVVGAIDIALTLQQNAVSKQEISTSGASSAVSVSGEGTTLTTPGSSLYFGDAINKVKSVLTSSDLPNLLKDGTFQDDQGTDYDYTQYINIGNNTISFDQPNGESEVDPSVLIAMSTDNGDPLYTEEVDFQKNVNFTSKDAVGQTITLFGKQYTVSSESTPTQLVLYGASQDVSLSKGDEKKITVNGNSYDVKVIGFSGSNTVALSVNGDVETLSEDSSKTVGGLKVFAKTVASWDNGNGGVATLQLGSQKLTLENGNEVMVGDSDDTIDGTLVTLNNGNGNNPVSDLSSIKIKVFAPDSNHESIVAGDEFKDPVFGTFGVKLLSVTPALTASSRDAIKLRTSGDDKAYVEFTDRYGNTKDVYFAYNDNGKILSQYDSDASDAIKLVENASAKEDNYIFLDPGDPKRTHIVKVQNIHVGSSYGDNSYVQFYDVMSGQTYKTQVFTYDGSNSDTTTLTVDGKQYKVWTSPDEVNVSSMDDDGIVVFPTMELKNGEDIAFTGNVTNLNIANKTKLILPTGSIVFDNTTDKQCGKPVDVNGIDYFFQCSNGVNGTLESISVVNETNSSNPGIMLVEEANNANQINEVLFNTIVTGTGSSSEIGFSKPTFTGYASKGVSTSDDDVTDYLDRYGTFVQYNDDSNNNQPFATIYYPDNQMYVTPAVLGTEATVTNTGSSSSGTVTTETVNPINLKSVVLDTELGTVTGQNIISVGGPAINKVTATLLGLKYPSYGAASGIPKDAGIVKLIDNTNNKVAIVVAGWGAEQTRMAADVLANYKNYATQLAGKTEVVVTGSLNSIVISNPTQ